MWISLNKNKKKFAFLNNKLRWAKYKQLKAIKRLTQLRKSFTWQLCLKWGIKLRDNACQETLLIDSEREEKLWKKLVLSLPVHVVLWNQLFFLCSRFRDLFSPTMFRLCPLFFWLLLSPLVASSPVSYVMLLSSYQGHPTTASSQMYSKGSPEYY